MGRINLRYNISQSAIRPSEVVDLLLTTPVAERDVHDIRQLYLKEKNKECVWTGQKLNLDFDVDHVIPFSLWRNNDLWNLLPCNSAINKKKRDMLPTRKLLVKREDNIVHYWRLVRSANNKRFDYEVSSILTRSASKGYWEKEMFSYLQEAVEITALQRSVQRWEPSSVI